MPYKIFLSYRRSDTAEHAIALKLVLEQYFYDVVVFVDTDSIMVGENWPDRLRQELQNSSIVLALMGSNWRFAPDGSDRLSDPNDWVNVELAYALNKSPDMVFPVNFVNSAAKLSGTKIEDLEDLPKELLEFRNIQNMQLRSESYVADVENIARTIAQKLKIETSSRGIEYPRPNKLKSMTPIISQNEFEALKQEDSSLSGWRFSSVLSGGAKNDIGNELSKSFEFKDFKRAFSFMNEAAHVAESRSHHPVWTNKWNKVDVHLRTFDAGQKVTWYDIEMAAKMNKIFMTVEGTQKQIWPLI